VRIYSPGTVGANSFARFHPKETKAKPESKKTKANKKFLYGRSSLHPIDGNGKKKKFVSFVPRFADSPLFSQSKI
jgi:hypothetical protein